MAAPTLTTDRLILVPMGPQHLSLHVRLDSDPEVMRYLLGRARTSQEASDRWEPECANQVPRALGLGFWMGYDRDRYRADQPQDWDAFVGWWDLDPSAVGPSGRVIEAEAGWRVRRDRWRQGLAIEAARAMLDHGFVQVGLERIWAETLVVNAGSRAVMGRLGMGQVRIEQRDQDEPIPGAEQGVYISAITADQWAARTDR